MSDLTLFSDLHEFGKKLCSFRSSLSMKVIVKLLVNVARSRIILLLINSFENWYRYIPNSHCPNYNIVYNTLYKIDSNGHSQKHYFLIILISSGFFVCDGGGLINNFHEKICHGIWICSTYSLTEKKNKFFPVQYSYYLLFTVKIVKRTKKKKKKGKQINKLEDMWCASCLESSETMFTCYLRMWIAISKF